GGGGPVRGRGGGRGGGGEDEQRQRRGRGRAAAPADTTGSRVAPSRDRTADRRVRRRGAGDPPPEARRPPGSTSGASSDPRGRRGRPRHARPLACPAPSSEAGRSPTARLV